MRLTNVRSFRVFVLVGVTVGADAIVAEDAAVSANVLQAIVAGGFPARVARSIDANGPRPVDVAR